jgi:hypothetical protein
MFLELPPGNVTQEQDAVKPFIPLFGIISCYHFWKLIGPIDFQSSGKDLYVSKVISFNPNACIFKICMSIDIRDANYRKRLKPAQQSRTPTTAELCDKNIPPEHLRNTQSCQIHHKRRWRKIPLFFRCARNQSWDIFRLDCCSLLPRTATPDKIHRCS